MKALVKPKPEMYSAWPKGLQYVDKATPQVRRPNDVQLRVVAAGICGTDVGIYQSKDSLKNSMSAIGTPNVTIGHEFCGTVADAGNAAKLRLAGLLLAKTGRSKSVAKFVKRRKAREIARDPGFIQFLARNFIATAEMHITCGKCAQCKMGEFHVCTNTVIRGLHGDGAFAEYVVLPAENILLFTKSEIPEEIIAFMDAIGNATHTVQSLSAIKGKSVAVLGAGVIGLMSVAIAKAAGARRILVTDASHGENSHEKLEEKRFSMARLLGADECFDVAIPKERERFYAEAKRENHGAGVDAVLEMSGSYHAYEDAFKVVRMGGELALLGLTNGTMPIDFAKNVIFHGVTIHGVIGRRVWSTWELMTDILRRGLAKRFLNAGFVTHEFPLERFEEAFAAIANGDALKVLLRPNM
jgi:threonine 3-dehydrogenase